MKLVGRFSGYFAKLSVTAIKEWNGMSLVQSRVCRNFDIEAMF